MKIDECVSTSPILRAVPFLDSSSFSPWPERLMEMEAWEKPARDKKEVLREYDEGWYRDLLDLWRAFVDEHDPSRANPATVLRFFYTVAKQVALEVEKNRPVYGSTQESYLFSMGDNLVVGDLVLGSMIHYDLIVHYVDKYLSSIPIPRTVVEPGCGMGVNLFHLYYRLGLERIVGGDICPNAVTLANSISRAYDIPGEFFIFDYELDSSLRDLTQGLEDYLLITCHSIEQIPVSQGFIENVLNSPNPPRMILHFEPMVWNDQTLMGRLCRRYAERNQYNLDLLRTIAKCQNKGRLNVLEYRKRCFGVSAFNPTSFLCWEPIR